jgi:hypothetical protein
MPKTSANIRQATYFMWTESTLKSGARLRSHCNYKPARVVYVHLVGVGGFDMQTLTSSLCSGLLNTAAMG